MNSEYVTTTDDSQNEMNPKKFDKKQVEQEQEEVFDHHGGGAAGSATVFGASLNLFKSLVGIGVLALPQAFSQSGWLAGLILLPLCAIAMVYLSQEIIKIAEKNGSKAKNVVEFVKQTVTRPHVIMVNASLFIFQTGICISYVIFFLQYIQESFCNIDSSNYSCKSKVVSVIVSLCLLIPLVFVRNMDKLKFGSMIGNVVVMISLVTVLIYCFINLKHDGSAEVSMVKWGSIGKSIGVFIFTFEGIGVYFNIRHSMKEPSKFNQVLNYSLFIGVALYCVVGFFGYLTFGDKVNDIILFSFESTNIPMQIVKFAYCFSLIFTFPVQIFPCINVVELKIRQKIYNTPTSPQLNPRDPSHGLNNTISDAESLTGSLNPLANPQLKKKQNMKFLIFSSLTRLFFVFITYTIGIIFDKISDFINLTGDVCGIYLCYVIPVFVIYYQDKTIPKYKTILNFSIMIIAIGFGIYGLYSTILQIKKDFFD